MGQRGRPGAEPMARFRAQPLDEPVQPLAPVVRDGAPLASGRLASIEWPTDQQAEWSLSFVQEGAPPRKLTVADAHGIAQSGRPREQRATTRPDARRGGPERISPCISRWSPPHKKTNPPHP